MNLMTREMKKFFRIVSLTFATCISIPALAIPSFSRQTGIDCQACHAQHMPILNDFGQSFKASGYRTVGKQTTIESENLSIPETLNASMLLKGKYQRSNGNTLGAIPGTTPNGGQWQFPDEFSLFFGGRIAKNIGFFFEGDTTASSTFLTTFKLPTAIELQDYNMSVIPFMTNTLGASYGYEQASTGAVRNATWAEHRKEVSAQQYVGTDGAATGVALLAINDKGYINLSRWAPAPLARSGSTQTLSSTYLRVAATPKFETQKLGEWAMHIGTQIWTGSNFAQNITSQTLAPVSTRAIALDFQAFGQINDQDLSLYATWSKSPAGSALEPNILNVGENKGMCDPTEYRLNQRSAFTVGADYSVIQNTLHVGAAFRSAKTGGQTGLAAVMGVNTSDNAITLTAVYNIAQNIELHANHSVYFGSLYNTPQPLGNMMTTIMLQAAW
jgi:hypothetical protein